MELLYLWIEDFRKIKQQGFTFNSQFIFENKKDDDRYVLTIRLNKSYVKIFPDQLSTVTGIVGRNGAGKSSLMHCLKMLYGQLPRLTSSLFFCLLDRQENTISTYYYGGGGRAPMQVLPVHVEADRELRQLHTVNQASRYTLNVLEGNSGAVKGRFKYPFVQTSCAYVSANFDSHREDYYHRIENESTNARMERFLKAYIPEQEKDAVRRSNMKNQERSPDPYPSYLKDFYKAELRSNVRFIAYANRLQKGNLPDLPSAITIEFNFEDFRYLTEKDRRNAFSRYSEQLSQIHKAASDLLISNNDKQTAFSDLLYLCTFYYAIRNKLFDSNSYTKGDLEGLLNMMVREPDEVYSNIRKTLGELNLSAENEKERRLIRSILGRGFSTALKNANLIQDPAIEQSPARFSFRADAQLWDLLGRIFDITYGEEINFMDYFWDSGLSTGEEALLTHFSRLYEIKRQIRRNNLMLLIDEGDLYFHPQWQKNYIHYLMEGIAFIFHNNKVQLVLSTHSPFIVSDLPKQNLLFLKKDASGQSVLSSSEIHTETFAANIHELFTNSFFLEDGLMGEYARKYLNDLIDEIKKEESISLERYESYYKNRIAIIGEQFLKTKIIELIAQRSDFAAVDQIFEQRSAELDYLRILRNKKRNDSNRT